MSQEFQREARYAVFKFSKLNGPQSKILQEAMCKLPRVDECLVIESDWPEYEPVWQMIEARMTAAPVPPPGVICDEVAPITEQAWRSLGLPPAGEAEVLKVQYRVSAGPQTGWSFWGEGNGDEFRNSYQVEVRELVDRAHVTRLTAENARLQAELKEALHTSVKEDVFDVVCKERDEALAEVAVRKAKHIRSCQLAIGKSQLAKYLQSELTKAREFPQADEIHQMAFEEGQPAENGDGYLFTAEEFDLFIERLISHQSAPAAPNQAGEQNG